MRTWVVVLASICAPVTAFGQPDPAAPAEAESAPPTPPAAGMPAPVPDQPVDEPAPAPSKFPSGMRIMASDLTILRLTPTGLETRARIGLQKKLYPSDTKITENNFYFAGVFPKLNPASAHIALGGELQ